MDLLVKQMNTTRIHATFKIEHYEIYSTIQRDREWIDQLLLLVSHGQDTSVIELSINDDTSIIYKFLYKCRVECDSSD